MRKILAVLFSALLLCTCGAILSACGHEHSYTNYVYNNDAKCEIDGTETATCDNGCEESHTRTKEGSALEHNYGYWISNGDNTHTKTCSHDSTHETTENCSGGTATCTEKAICSSCNSEYGNLEDHPYSTEWTINETHHYHASTCDCGEKKDYGEHTPDDSGFCTACDKAINYTNGIIYDTSSDGTYAEVIGYEGSSTKINIAPTYNNLPVKSIYDSAFENTNITKVIIPESVTSIGNYAFYNCRSLTSIEIPDSVTYIGYCAFQYCNSLTSVTIGDSVTTIEGGAFYECYSLTSIEIPDSVTSIGSSAFYCCWSLTSIEIPDSVTSIGSNAFYDCPEALFYIEGNVKYLIRGDNKYFAVLGVTNNNSSSYTIKDGAKIIAGSAFSGCARLSSIEIPDSVTTIGEEAFYKCSSLTSVTIGDSVTSIGYRAFFYCSSLTSVTIGDSVTSIGSQAFYDCDSLTSVTIGDSVTSIGNGAFYDCSSLASVTFKDTSTWYMTDDYENWTNKTGGSQTDVTNPTQIASYLRNNYSYYCYKL